MEIRIFDDPLNPYGWGNEPAVRVLRSAAPDATWEFQPTVLVDDWERYDGPEFPNGRSSVAAVCSRISERSGMPIDEYLWFSEPPSTSRFACRGVAAALERGPEAGWQFLRAAREATFLRQTNLDTPEAVRELADSVPALDADEFGSTLSDSGDGLDAAPYEGDAADLGRDDRPELPTLVVEGPDGKRKLAGTVDRAELSHAVERATGSALDAPDLSVSEVLDRFSAEGWLATTELSVLADRSRREAVEEARDADGVAEAEFASESFFRRDEFANAPSR